MCSLHLYASFGTFCVQIGQSFAPQWVFKHSKEFRNRRHFPLKTATVGNTSMNPKYSIRMQWTNFRQPTAHVQQNIFGKTPTEVCSPCLYASFDTFLRQNWLIIQQLTVFEGKCRWFRISSECLKTHCGANNWPIWTQQVPKEA